MEFTEEPVIMNVPSLAIREKHQITNLVRSISLNTSESISFEPPCYSNPCSPLRFFDDSSSQSSDPLVTYKCTSSVLAKDGQILCIAVLNGSMAYTGSQSDVIRIWKLPEFTEVGQLKSKAKMVVAIHVSNDKVFAAYGDCKIRVWSRRNCRGVTKHVRLATIPKNYVRSYISGKDKMMKHMAPISSLDISLSDDIIYSASLDRTVKVWRISDRKCMETIHAHSAPINAIVVADNGVLYTASDDATVKVWHRNSGSTDNSCPHDFIVTLQANLSPIKTLTLNNDAGILYGGCTDGCIHYWLKGWFSGQLQYGGLLQGHTHAILCLASFSKFVVSGSADSTVRIWVRQQNGEHNCVAVLKGHRGPIKSLVAFPGRVVEDGDQDSGCIVCTGSMDGVLKFWQVI